MKRAYNGSDLRCCMATNIHPLPRIQGNGGSRHKRCSSFCRLDNIKFQNGSRRMLFLQVISSSLCSVINVYISARQEIIASSYIGYIRSRENDITNMLPQPPSQKAPSSFRHIYRPLSSIAGSTSSSSRRTTLRLPPRLGPSFQFLPPIPVFLYCLL